MKEQELGDPEDKNIRIIFIDRTIFCDNYFIETDKRYFSSSK